MGSYQCNQTQPESTQRTAGGARCAAAALLPLLEQQLGCFPRAELEKLHTLRCLLQFLSFGWGSGAGNGSTCWSSLQRSEGGNIFKLLPCLPVAAGSASASRALQARDKILPWQDSGMGCAASPGSDKSPGAAGRSSQRDPRNSPGSLSASTCRKPAPSPTGSSPCYPSSSASRPFITYLKIDDKPG